MYKKSAHSQQGRLRAEKQDWLHGDEFWRGVRLSVSPKERCHFEFGEIKAEAFLENMRSINDGLRKNSIRKPRDVSIALNRHGVKTACKEKWTPRLVWILLALLYNSKEFQPAQLNDTAASKKKGDLFHDGPARPKRRKRGPNYFRKF